MIKYRVECKVQKAVAEEWEKYFVEVHLDDVLKTGCFTSYVFNKAIDNDEDAVTFVSEYICSSIEKLEEYNQKFASAIKKDVQTKFNGKFTCQRSIFELITKK